jgi:CBS domain-containing protein
MHTTIQEAMTSNPTRIGPTNTVEEAAQIMKAEDIGSLPIVEGDKLVGVITDRDLAIRVVAESRGTDTTVGDIASKNVVTVDPEQSLEDAARLRPTPDPPPASSRRRQARRQSWPRPTSQAGTTRRR